MLTLPGYKPGFRDRLKSGSLTDDERDRRILEPRANLAKTLMEGVSLAYEYELLDHLKHQTRNRPLLGALDTHLQERQRSAREINRLFSPNFNLKSRRDIDGSIDPANLHYSEGIKLAIALRRNGWDFANLPELMEIISQVVHDEVGDDHSSDGELMLRIGVSTDPDSSYQRITTVIRNTKKP